MPVRPLLILLTVALASGAQATAERAGWMSLAALAPTPGPSIDGAQCMSFHPAAQAGAGLKGETP